MILYNTCWKTAYQLDTGYNGWRLKSRFKIVSTNEYHYLYDNRHGMSRHELIRYITSQRKDFIIMEDLRFDILEEIISD